MTVLSRQTRFRDDDSITPYSLNKEFDNIINTWNSVNSSSSGLNSLALGVASSITGLLTLYNSSSTNGTGIQAGNASAAITYTLPTAGPAGNSYALVSSTAGVLSWANTTGSFAPLGAAYVTIGNDATLTNERALTGTTNQIIVTDNGANSTAVLSLPQSINTGATVTFGVQNLNDVTLSPGNPASGPGGNTFNGGILTQLVKNNENYQVCSYQVAPTAGSAPAWGPITEYVCQRTVDQSTNYQRISFTAMAAFADPGLADAAVDYRIQMEAAGTQPRLPLKFTTQTNDTSYLVEYLILNTDGSVQLFRRSDSPAPTGNNLEFSLDTQKRGTSNVLTSNGTQDSPSLRQSGKSYDGSLHSVDWKWFVNSTSNAGASTYKLQSRIDAASYGTQLLITDQGAATFNPTSGNNTTLQLAGTTALQVGGTAVGSSIPITVSSGNINFSTAGMGNLGSVYYIARGVGSTLDRNVPTGATHEWLVNNSLVFSANGSNVIMALNPRFNGTNTTGSGTALLGANSPASTNAAPYTWIQALSSDGSTVYIPAWK